jgi:hypothetical protein
LEFIYQYKRLLNKFPYYQLGILKNQLDQIYPTSIQMEEFIWLIYEYGKTSEKFDIALNKGIMRPSITLFEAERKFHEIAERGIQWQYASENEHEIEGNIKTEHWEYYGENTWEAAQIFNKQYPKYQATIEGDEIDISYWVVKRIEPPKSTIKLSDLYNAFAHDWGNLTNYYGRSENVIRGKGFIIEKTKYYDRVETICKCGSLIQSKWAKNTVYDEEDLLMETEQHPTLCYECQAEIIREASK